MINTLLRIDRDGPVAIVRLTRGVTNSINGDLVGELAAAVRHAKEQPEIRGLVLASANAKFFSIGWDIPQMIGLTRSEFADFFSWYNRMCLDLYTLPKPTVAAVTGHAIAGGCILTLCCDYRYVADGKKLMGLNEIKLGAPLPYVVDCMLPALVGGRYAREIMESGDFYPPDAALRMGLVDAVLPPDQVLPASVEKAKQLGAMPEQAFAIIKRNRTAGIEKQIAAQLEEQERRFVECWYSEVARERLREAAAKF
ncbi:MAG: enoyl-CoA hydratase/isomerase family protein [Candidatus Binatia bacterium]|jgi:enoyl-CoA hydratase/carnithine racemase